MGILDDARREHLDRKRAHGASDDEIRRKEAEAFGPVRQDAGPAPAPVDEHTQLLAPADHPLDLEAAEPADAPIADLEPLEPALEDPYAVHPGDQPVPDESAPPAPVHHHPDEQHPALVDHDHIHHEEHPPEPVFRQSVETPLDPAPVDDPPVGDPPVERPGIDEPPPRQSPERAADHEVGDFEPKEEDVLEETPEFLQDAPEHDRLWFEQKPPRDFDFGE